MFGKSIAKGDVLCVIEAMKLFNKLNLKFHSKKNIVDDMSPVEFDQPYFAVDPS
jgi:acetyl-CoA carboxylase biotin carboxyl carrier protein